MSREYKYWAVFKYDAEYPTASAFYKEGLYKEKWLAVDTIDCLEQWSKDAEFDDLRFILVDVTLPAKVAKEVNWELRVNGWDEDEEF